MSNNLDIDQVAEGQTQSHITINDANAQLDAKLTEQITVDVTSLDVTLTDNQFRRNRAITVTGATTPGRSVLIPQIKGSIEVISDATNSEDFNVVRGSTTTVVSPSQVKSFLTDGTLDGVLVTGGSSSTGGSTTFLGLSDTPGTFVGNANKTVKVDPTGAFLEFGDASIVTAAHRGCVLRLTSNVSLPDPTSEVLAWGAEDFDTDDFHDNVTNNTRITIPAGVTKVKLSYGFYSANDVDSGGWSKAHIRKNGEAEPGRGFSSEDMSTDSGGDNQGFIVSTPTLEVVAGDFFEVVHGTNTGGATITIQAGNATYFECIVVEDDQVVSAGADDFTDLGDTPASYAGFNNYFAKVNSTATGIDFILNSILSLADTPSVFGAAGQVLATNGTLDGTEWVDNTGGGGGTTFMGAFVTAGNQSQSIGTLGSPRFEFDNEVYDEGGFFDSGSSVTRFTIPSGVTRVILKFGAEFQSSAITDGETLQLQFFKNGSVMTPRIRKNIETSTGFTDFNATLESPVLQVTAGDYFEIVGNFSVSAAQQQDDTWFSIQAV